MAKAKPPVARIEDAPEPEAPRADEVAADASATKAEKTAKPKAKVAADSEPPKTKAAPASESSRTDEDDVARRTGLTGWVAQVFPGHEHAVIGGLAGLLVAVLFFLLGFWRTVLVCLLVSFGVAVGQYLDGDPKMVDLIRRALGDGRGNN